MRIGLSTFEVQNPGRGAPGYTLPLTRALLALDEAPELVLFLREQDVAAFASLSGPMQRIVVPETLGSPEQLAAWESQQLPWLAQELRLDVLHLPEPRPLPWRGACPLVATLQECPAAPAGPKTGWVRRLYEGLLSRRPFRQFNRFIATNDHAAREFLKRFSFPAGQMEIIPNGIDHGLFHPVPPFEAKMAMAERFEFKEPFFLYVAPLDHPASNHVGLLAAFNRFKRRKKATWLLVLAGDEGLQAEKIHAAIRQSPYLADIFCVGALPPAELAVLYRAAEVFVFPTLRETSDLTVVEAMACGCPVIASARGAWSEVVGEAASLIDPDDVEDLAGSMAALADSLELRQTWRTAGLGQARKFNWQRTAQDTLAVYGRVAT